MFRDRQEAAHRLVQRLDFLHGQHPLVLALAPHGVPLGRLLANEFDGELDITLVRALAVPTDPGRIVGAVGESGRIHISSGADLLGVAAADIEAAASAHRRWLGEQRARYTPGRPARPASGRVVLLVDDAVVAAAEMLAAVEEAKAQTPRRLLVATAVATPEALAALEAVAETICLLANPFLHDARQHFEHYPEADEQDVIRMLESTPTGFLPAHLERRRHDDRRTMHPRRRSDRT